MQTSKQHPVRFIVIFYLVCFFFRAVEYFFIRTDTTVLGEAFIHKLIGIALIAAAVRLLRYKWTDIGFCAGRIINGVLLGLLLGVGVFAAAYGAEMLMQAGNAPSLQMYVTSYAIEGNRSIQGGILFVFICIAGNVINVIMEEGAFRGLFMRLMEEKYSFAKACAFSSVLFGVWHIAQPVRNVLDGQQSVTGAVMSALLLVVTSALLGVQYCMLYKITGSLWAGMAAHFVNNAGINLIHIVTASGADELQVVRISIAQTLSFVVVLIFFLKYQRRKKNLKI